MDRDPCGTKYSLAGTFLGIMNVGHEEVWSFFTSICRRELKVGTGKFYLQKEIIIISHNII